MDLPLILEHGNLITGAQELKQTIGLLLKTSKGDFVQDPTLGYDDPIHTQNISLGEIRRVVEVIPYLSVEDISVEGEEVNMKILYKNSVEQFTFQLDE